jgi:hypothetical protein
MICFQAALWRYSAVDKATEDLAPDADDTIILSDTDSELDRLTVLVPAGVLGEAEKHAAVSG